MLTFFNAAHTQHAAAFEIFRGDKVPAFESPARADAVAARLRARGHRFATEQDTHDAAAVVARIHTPRYLAFLQTAWQQWVSLDPANAQREPFPSVWPVRTLRSDVEPTNFTGKLGLYSMDNGAPILAGTWAAVKAGADMAHSAARVVAHAEVPVAFCLSRPPGHHAGADFMGGYCFLNNAAIAAQTLLDAGTPRVALLDVDYHHGNGTQSIFYHRDDVQFISIHGDPRTEYPFYLGHGDEGGEGAGLGFNLNLPLAARSSVASWFDALDTACARVQACGAQALVVSLGLDTFVGDPISTFGLGAADFSRLGAHLSALNLPTVFVFEGGYATTELAVNTVNVLEGFEHG